MSSFTARRVVVKVGTSTLSDAAGRIDREFIADLTAQLARLHHQGCEVLLVTSGAIRAGRDRLEREHSFQRSEGRSALPSCDSLPYKQAAAALGQGRLIRAYTEAFDWRNIDCAQILLTGEDLSDRRRFLNARNTLLALLSLGIIPVINENDTVSVDEIKFGDNDMLAALTATLIEADLLLILSDVEGLYATAPDAISPASADDEVSHPKVIRVVSRIDAEISALASGSRSGVGTGGMRTKIEAARIATEAGIKTIIAQGRRPNVVLEAASGEEIGTAFLPCTESSRLSARKRWIAHSARPRGVIVVNEKAAIKLKGQGVSLLAVGIESLQGSFVEGDLVEIQDPEGSAFARGLTNYPASELRRVKGLHSEDFEAVLGYEGCAEVIHRDNMVVGNS